MKAIVVNPWATDFKLYDEWMHPVGLYFLVSLLRHNGIDVSWYNCLWRTPDTKTKRHNTGVFHEQEYPKPQVYRSVKRKYRLYGVPRGSFTDFLSSSARPDIALVGTGMTYWLPGLVETVGCIREVHPGLPVVVGGAAARLMPHALQQALPEVHVCTHDLFSAQSLRNSVVPHLRMLSMHGWTPSFRDMASLLGPTPHAPVLASLGCPLACSYCASRALHGIYRARSTDVVLDEIRALARIGATDFSVHDDALLYQPDTAFFPLARGLPAAAPGARFHTPNGLHARMVSPAVAQALRAAGFVTVRLGYESGSPAAGHHTSAKTTRTELASAIDTLTAAGIAPQSIGVYVMAGLPDQKPADVADEISFVASLGVAPRPVFLSPVPGTTLFSLYARRFPQIEHDPLFHNDSFFVSLLDGWSYDATEEIRAMARAAAARG